jgi:hypothetical protein
MLSEVLAVTAIMGLMTSMAVVDVGKVIGHARSIAAVTTIAEVLASARLQAINRSIQVVVEISVEPPPSRRIGLRTFEDRNNDFLLDTWLPAGATTPVAETILNDFVVDSSFHLWRQGQAKDDIATAALFNTYNNDASLKQRVAFQPDGGIAPPQGSDSGAPAATAGRGIYVADNAGKGFYRVTFATPLLARPRIDKWNGATEYVAGQGSF